MLIGICFAVSFGPGVGMGVIASNEFGFCFLSSKEQKPPDKVDSLNSNLTGSKMIVVFTDILLMASYFGLTTDHRSILLISQVDSVPSFHSSIQERILCEKDCSQKYSNKDPNTSSTIRAIVEKFLDDHRAIRFHLGSNIVSDRNYRPILVAIAGTSTNYNSKNASTMDAPTVDPHAVCFIFESITLACESVPSPAALAAGWVGFAKFGGYKVKNTLLISIAVSS